MPKLRIDVFTHNVKCTQFDTQAKQALLSYTSKVARVDLVPDPEWDPRSGRRRRMVKKIVKIYAALRQDRTEFRFHVNQYEELMQTLSAHGIWEKDIEVIRHPEPAYVPHDFKLTDKRTPRDYQIEKIEYLENDQRSKIMIAQTGTGKYQCLHSKVLTPTGWAVMADMEVGTVVATPGGSHSKVIGVYPQGIRSMYAVTTVGGRWAEAGLPHLWLARIGGTEPKVVTTTDLRDSLSGGAVVELPVGVGDTGSKWEPIAHIRYTSDKYAQCIEIDSPEHLYITDDYIVTHNTMMALRAIHTQNKRVFLALTKNVYTEKWIDDVEDAYACKKGDIVVIKGTKQLATLIACAQNDDLDAKFIICSMRTLQMYIEKYEAGDDVIGEYGCNPEDLFPTLKVGIRFIDEVHEHFHTVFKLDLYSHVSETINLTATLIDDNVFVERMMRVMFPMNERPPKSPYDKYIETIAYSYGFSDEGRRAIPYKQPGRGSYSHVRFESSVMKSKKYLNRYLGFIQKTAEETFFGVRQDKQRLLIFCSTIAMCEEVVKHFKTHYPKLNVAKYTAEDNYETLLSADVVVSTLLSAGTAVDIPDLRTVIMTTAIGSRRQNVQALGRLRRMSRYPTTTPTFAYFVCSDIEEHLKYYEKKVEVFADKTLVHKVEHTSFSL